MDKFLIRSNIGQSSSNGSSQPSVSSNIAPEIQRGTIFSPPSNVDSVLQLESPNTNPKERIPNFQYAPNNRDEVRRHYIQKGLVNRVVMLSLKLNLGTKCNELESRSNVGDAFTKNGFKDWNKGAERLRIHVGEVSSIHHKCFNRIHDLINHEQSIQSSFHKQSEKAKNDHRIHLNTSVDVVRFLLRNGLSFRGHDESEHSEDIFLELLEFHGDKHSDVGNVILHKAPKNDMMICPAIQKNIVGACAKEPIKAIIKDLDYGFFRILVDESKDISYKEQMALVIQYVNKRGELTLVALSKKHLELLRQHQVEKLEELLKSGKILIGQGLNQERGLQRPGDTCWSSHFKILENFLIIFSFIVNVLQDIQQDSHLSLDRFAAKNLLGNIQEFEFVFLLHLMFKMLLLTNELNKALQKKDQDIINAMRFLDLAKIRLPTMRESEFEFLMNEVYSFCSKHDIMIPKMDEDYPRSK
ncbi:uncharacterized protein LOC142164018 [Nicotiana tabacum]|uniref:Uncharacterized protein LOC142164018 n=1 Tax=Nicotiana tabacum TaxID=4097 RepID=A0AC58RX33_TOBAC